MTRIFSLAIIMFFFHASCTSQDSTVSLPLTFQDTLRGSVTPERKWWDVAHYQITVEPDFNTKTISGKNIIAFLAKDSGRRMQIDLQQPMLVNSVVSGRDSLSFTRNGNVYYIQFPSSIAKGSRRSVEIRFSGKPREAVNPPWDGGWIWKTDSYGNPWMSVACQGLGASVWYPCKDYQGDEPDSASLTMIAPATLMAIGNGRLRHRETRNDKVVFTWAVTSPINSYNIVPYIGRYVNWSETFAGEKGTLDLSYWVLEENKTKAVKQFKQVPKMMKCFEHWFGPYPFYADGYKLVESPHLGMEHQSAIAYGNNFENGYLGKDLSGTGWGDKWDFIIVHESGHEWFANNITTADIADMWVHEGFTNYSEVLYTTCEFGVKAGNEYGIGLRQNIQNDKPVIGTYNVNKEGSGDMYAKGANIVHMIRQIIDNDDMFRTLLRNMNEHFYHQIVTGNEVEAYLSEKVGKNLSKMFDQYLRTTDIPVLEHEYRNGSIRYRWSNCVAGFDMPVRLIGKKDCWLQPTTTWKTQKMKDAGYEVDPNFYIGSRKL